MKQDQPGIFVPCLLLQMLVLILGKDVWPEAKGGRKLSLDVKTSLPKGRAISKINQVIMEAAVLQVNQSFSNCDWHGATQEQRLDSPS